MALKLEEVQSTLSGQRLDRRQRKLPAIMCPLYYSGCFKRQRDCVRYLLL